MTECSKLIALVERTEYNVSEFQFTRMLISEKYEFIEVSGDKFRMTVTGFLICCENIIVVFPKGYVVPELPQKDAASLLRVLLRYRNSRNLSKDEISMLHGDQTYRSGRLASAVALLDDYYSNGFLKRTVKAHTSKSSGFIDWNKTIKVNVPIVSKSRPLYLSPVVRTTNADPHNVVSMIHRSIVSECISMFGWLLGLENDTANECRMPVSPDAALDILYTELGRTFVQREIEVLKLMVQYLSAVTGRNSKTGVELLATPYFYNTWEAICGFIFQNQYTNLKHLIPQPSWKNAIVSGKISQRPDILYVHNQSLYILDAKYYDYTVSLPGWHDVVKQLFYRFTLEKSCMDKKVSRCILSDIVNIKNVFILPENSQRDFVHLGDISVDSVKELETIYVIAINTAKAMDIYARGARFEYRDSLEEKLDHLNAI